MKSFVRIFAALATLLLSLSAYAQTHAGHLPQTDGVIKKIDATAGKVTIAHGEIANLKMPPMTMSFKAKDPAMLKQWKEGDKVRFRSTEDKGVLTIVSIEAAK
jgi:Cu(I)/Ag(I) efflux system periplasmic protein CusF